MPDRPDRDSEPTAHDTPEDAFSRAVTGVADLEDTAAAEAPERRLVRGDSAGRYVILNELGAGGMGVVYKAYDPDLDRRIALKILKVKAGLGIDGPIARDRLLREAQALAHLSHPNVVSAYDVGTMGDSVFMAMELVEGQTLSRWLRESKPARPQILEVLIAAGQGLAAAHQAGLIHRDFKPENVVVGADGRVRVIDFGLSRALDRESTPPPAGSPPPAAIDAALEERLGSSSLRLRATLTMAGTIVGSPGYMSPEQCLGETQDEKSDQFSFCATLHFALTGVQAFSGRSWAELKRKVIEGQLDPVPPSARVPAWLRRIIHRGLAVDPHLRYPTMNTLLQDLAKDPRILRRRLLGGAAVVLAIAGCALLAALWRSGQQKLCRGAEERLTGAWDPAARAAVREAFAGTGRPYAADTFARVAKVLDERAAAWVDMRTEACAATRLRGEQSEQLMDLRMRCLDRALSELRALTTLFAARPDPDVLDKAVPATLDLAAIDRCADTTSLTAAFPPPDDPAVRAQVEAMRARLDEARALFHAGKVRAGLAIAREVTTAAVTLGYPPLSAEALLLQGTLEADSGEAQHAEQNLSLAAEAAALAKNDALLARASGKLISVLGGQQARYGEALAIGRIALHNILRAGDDPLIRAEALNDLGVVKNKTALYDQALEYFRQALALREHAAGADHPDIARTLNNIGLIFVYQGQTETATPYFVRAVGIMEAALGADHPAVAGAHYNLGLTYIYQGQYDESRREFQRAATIREQAFGPTHPDLAQALNALGSVSAARGDFAEARTYQERALAILEQALGPAHPDITFTLNNLGEVLVSEGRYAEAQRLYERALQIRAAKLGDKHADTLTSLVYLGRNIIAQGRFALAMPYFRRAVAGFEEIFGPTHPKLVLALTGLGECLLNTGEAERARAPLERALQLRQGKPGDPAAAAEIQFLLGQALWTSPRERGRARRLATDARDTLRKGGDKYRKLLAATETWLAGRGGPR